MGGWADPNIFSQPARRRFFRQSTDCNRNYHDMTPVVAASEHRSITADPGISNSSSTEMFHQSSSGYRQREGSPRPGSSRSRGSRDQDVEAWIKERHSRERPSRTLFVRNVYFECDERELEERFSEFGQLREFFSMTQGRGIAFVTFYDLRDAKRAKETLNGVEMGGRAIDVHYSLPRETITPSTKCDNSKNQGTLFVIFENPGAAARISEKAIRDKFEQFGDIINITTLRDYHAQRFVEYYDSRACEQAQATLHHTMFEGSRLVVEFAWDKSTKEAMYLGQANRDRDDFYRKQDRSASGPGSRFGAGSGRGGPGSDYEEREYRPSRDVRGSERGGGIRRPRGRDRSPSSHWPRERSPAYDRSNYGRDRPERSREIRDRGTGGRYGSSGIGRDEYSSHHGARHHHHQHPHHHRGQSPSGYDHYQSSSQQYGANGNPNLAGQAAPTLSADEAQRMILAAAGQFNAPGAAGAPAASGLGSALASYRPAQGQPSAANNLASLSLLSSLLPQQQQTPQAGQSNNVTTAQGNPNALAQLSALFQSLQQQSANQPQAQHSSVHAQQQVPHQQHQYPSSGQATASSVVPQSLLATTSAPPSAPATSCGVSAAQGASTDTYRYAQYAQYLAQLQQFQQQQQRGDGANGGSSTK